MVGVGRFELPASCSQSRRANQAALHPVIGGRRTLAEVSEPSAGAARRRRGRRNAHNGSPAVHDPSVRLFTRPRRRPTRSGPTETRRCRSPGRTRAASSRGRRTTRRTGRQGAAEPCTSSRATTAATASATATVVPSKWTTPPNTTEATVFGAVAMECIPPRWAAHHRTTIGSFPRPSWGKPRIVSLGTGSSASGPSLSPRGSWPSGRRTRPGRARRRRAAP